MLRATLKSLLAHRLRLALTACAVALGVAFMAGTFILTATIRHGVDSLFANASAGTDVIVRPVAATTTGTAGRPLGRASVPASLVGQVRSVAGVAVADGVIRDRAGIIGKDGKVAGGRVGVVTSWPADPALATGYPVRQGRPPAGPGEVAIDAASARRQGLHMGDQVRVLVHGTARPFTISAIVGFGQADGPGPVSLAAFDAATAQRLLGKSGTFDELDLKADAGVTAAALRDRVAGMLPGGLEAVTAASAAATQAEDLRHGIGFLTNGLLVFALISLFVGAFIIWNTFSILVAQRTRELALLRALGASRRQVLRSVLLEAGVVGTVASAAGLGLGVLAAAGLRALLRGAGIDLPASGLELPASSAAIAVGTGIAVTVAAAVAPARRATTVAPIQALREAAPTLRTFSTRRLVAGAALLVPGTAALLTGLFGGTGGGAVLVGGGALAVFIGVTVLGPLFARPLAWVIGAPLRPLPARAGQLARDNAMRNPKRTAATAAALMVGLALVSASAVLDASLKRTADQAIDRGSRADLYVQSPDPDSGLAPALARSLAAQPGVAAVSELREVDATVAGASFQKVDGIDPGTVEQVADLDVRSGSVAALGNGDALLVASTAASAHHWTIGSPVTIRFEKTGASTLRVAGTYANKGAFGDYLVSLDTFARATGRTVDTLLMVKAAGTGVGALQARIGGLLGPYPGAKVLDQSGFKRSTGAALDQILNLITALLALAVLIALLGIVNTLALSVVERTRELGLLRAIGMRRSQLGAMVAGEAVIIAVLGAVLGITLGVGLGSALADALTAASNGSAVVTVPGAQLVLYVIGAGIAGIVAAIAPARRAARLDMLTAISSD
jgi:putative ABC transport system permease protein